MQKQSGTSRKDKTKDIKLNERINSEFKTGKYIFQLKKIICRGYSMTIQNWLIRNDQI